MGKFAEQVAAAVAHEKLRREKVLVWSLKLLHDEAKRTVFEGGRLPYDTGNLYRSFLVSTAAMPVVSQEDKEFPDATALNVNVIEGVKLGDVVYMGYQAAYAPRVNYGFTGRDSLGRVYNTTGYMFIEHVQGLWPRLVKEAERIVGNG